MKQNLRWLLPALALLAGALSVNAARAPGADPDTLSERQFFNPPLAARPSVLWTWLNGYVQTNQLTRELEEMKAKGLAGAIIWDLGSLRDPKNIIPAGPEFLGPQSLQSIAHAMDAASRLGLELGLSAASSWNAGGSWVKPEQASQKLLCSTLPVKGPARIAATVPLPAGASKYWTDIAVLAVPQGNAPATAAGSPALDISRHMDAQGRLTWDAPAGEWQIMRFIRSNTDQHLMCPSPQSRGLLIDHLSSAAARSDLEHVIGALRSVRPNLGALKSIFLDSFEVDEALDWTGEFIRAFKAAHRYDPIPYLPALFGSAALRPDIAERFRYDYRQTVSDLLVGNHYRTARETANKHGLRLLAEAGHGGSARMDVLKAMGAVDVPMGEFWNHERFWVVKEAAAAAHIYGKRIVDAETLTGWRHWQDGPQEYKRRIDVAFCAGLNHSTFHTFAHNPPEAGLPGFVYHAGEHFNVNNTWWPCAGPLIEYMARCSYLLQRGRFVADVCFYYGDQAPNLVPTRRIDPDIKPIYPANCCLHCGQPKPVDADVLEKGYDFDYVNTEVILERMQVRDGRIVLKDGMSYAVLALPDREDMPPAVLKKLGELAQKGATIVGRKPRRANGLNGFPQCDDDVRKLADRIWGPCDGVNVKEQAYGQGAIVWGVPLNDVLRRKGLRPDFRVLQPANEDRRIDYIHRATGTEDIFFVSNSSLSNETVECVFRMDGHKTPEFWLPAEGQIVPCRDATRVEGGVKLTLPMPAASSLFVVFRTTPTAPEHLSPAPLPVDAQPVAALNGPWTLRFPPGWGAPESVTWPTLLNWAEADDPGIRYFSGTACYFTEFEMPADLATNQHAFQLDLGRLREVAELTLNGVNLGILWKEPFVADITRAIRPRKNRLEIKVTNLWFNRLVGDLLSGDQKKYTRTNINFNPKEKVPLPAGLFGPVRILSAAKTAPPVP